MDKTFFQKKFLELLVLVAVVIGLTAVAVYFEEKNETYEVEEEIAFDQWVESLENPANPQASLEKFVGGWEVVSGEAPWQYLPVSGGVDWQSMNVERDYTYSTFLHDRPFEQGGWKIKDNTISLTSDVEDLSVELTGVRLLGDTLISKEAILQKVRDIPADHAAFVGMWENMTGEDPWNSIVVRGDYTYATQLNQSHVDAGVWSKVGNKIILTSKTNNSTFELTLDEPIQGDGIYAGDLVLERIVDGYTFNGLPLLK